jgi:CRISPR type I-E-associated protein CasB/Cse2
MATLLDGKDEKYGNMGETLRTIVLNEGNKEEALASFEPRFRRLLSCRTAEEVCKQLTVAFRAAKQKNVSISFRKLYWDLEYWENPERQVKIEWAKAYWGEKNALEKGESQ